MTMTLKEAYNVVKSGLTPEVLHCTTDVVKGVHRLLSLVDEMNESYNCSLRRLKHSDTELSACRIDISHMFSARQCQRQEYVVASRLENLGACFMDKNPVEVCCGCGCELPDEGRMKYTVVTIHFGGKRNHEVCQECFGLIHHEAQVLEKLEYRGFRYKHQRSEEAGFPLYMNYREIYERAIYNVLGAEKGLYYRDMGAGRTREAKSQYRARVVAVPAVVTEESYIPRRRE